MDKKSPRRLPALPGLVSVQDDSGGEEGRGLRDQRGSFKDIEGGQTGQA